MRLNDRRLDGEVFKRRKATQDTQRKITDWEIWTCSDPNFTHEYDRTVTMFVREGAAVLTFSNGEIIDLEPGDTLTIQKGTSVIWDISAPIKNSFRYHDTFISAESRSKQVRWRNV